MELPDVNDQRGESHTLNEADKEKIKFMIYKEIEDDTQTYSMKGKGL